MSPERVGHQTSCMFWSIGEPIQNAVATCPPFILRSWLEQARVFLWQKELTAFSNKSSAVRMFFWDLGLLLLVFFCVLWAVPDHFLWLTLSLRWCFLWRNVWCIVGVGQLRNRGSSGASWRTTNFVPVPLGRGLGACFFVFFCLRLYHLPLRFTAFICKTAIFGCHRCAASLL